MVFKDDVKAFQVSMKVSNLVNQFTKDFLEIMKDYDVEKKLTMYSYAIRLFKGKLDKKLK